MFLSLIVQQQCDAQDTASIRKYQSQLRLIDSIKSFITNHLGLRVPEDFYTAWNDAADDSMYIYLYASKPERVEPDIGFGAYALYSNEAQAQSMSRLMQARGFQTMLYRTAGNSTTRLSKKLLSYPPEAIAFIVIHEVVHRNLFIAEHRINYCYEEALCDVIADSACPLFAEMSQMVDIKAAQKQRDIFQRTYAYINKQRAILDTLAQDSKPAFYKVCQKTIYEWTADANQFQKDRLNYEVNNAYFLRIDDYSRYYFTVERFYSEHSDFKEAIEKILEFEKDRTEKK